PEVEPVVNLLIVIQTCVADTAFARNGIFRSTLKGTVQGRSNNQVLTVAHFRAGSVLPHMVKESNIGAYRYVIPGDKPETGHVKIHIVMIESALVPGFSIGLAAYHIIKYLFFALYMFQNILNRQMSQCFGPVHRWVL